MDAFKIVGIIVVVILGIIMIVALAFMLELGGLKWDEFFGPKHADVERKTFERTKSYNEAKSQELLKYRLEYMRSKDPDEKHAIANTVRHAFADYDESLLEPELAEWLRRCKRGDDYFEEDRDASND